MISDQSSVISGSPRRRPEHSLPSTEHRTPVVPRHLTLDTFPIRTLTVLLLIVALPGCQHGPAPVPEHVLALSQLSYPAEAELAADLDIVVVRRGPVLLLTNRTAYPYEQMQLWLNQQYVSQIETIIIGPENRLNLNQFINRHREPFPVAGFLSPDKAFPVVLAELYDPEAHKRYRLTVNVLDQPSFAR